MPNSFDLGVLTKNYADNIESALSKSTSGPVTFRSGVRWTSASSAFDGKKRIALYIVAEGGTGVVKYQGVLDDILLYPSPNTAAVERLLARTPDVTSSEGLWGNTVKTLYSVRDLHALSEPFHQSELLKRSDGKPVSHAYDRSYCLVDPRE